MVCLLSLLTAQVRAEYINNQLNPLLVPDGDVSAFVISADSERVIYRADQDTDEVDELYSVPIGGGAAAKLNGTLVSGGEVYDFAVSSDNTRAVYRADQDSEYRYELYSVPIAGGANVKLNGPLVEDGRVIGVKISPDAARVVYRAEVNSFEMFDLESVPIGGGTPVQLNDPLAGSHSRVREDFIIAQGGQVVYRADQDTWRQKELYSVPVGGGTPVKLNSPLPSDGDVWDFAVSVDSQRVIYRADHNTDNVGELYSVPIGGGTPVKLNGRLIRGGEVEDFLISTDSTRVVYRAIQETLGKYELYSVPIAGGTPVKLNAALTVYNDVEAFAISEDSTRVVYQADQDLDERFELYSVPVGGGTPVKLNGPLVSEGDVKEFRISPDSVRVVYRADHAVDERDELFSVPIDGGNPIKLNGVLIAGGAVSDFTISADSTWVAYRADQDIDGVSELYGVPIAGGAAGKLHPALNHLGGVEADYEISSDSEWIVYRANQNGVDTLDVFSTRWRSPDLTIDEHTVSGSSPYYVGDMLDWSVTVRNTGDADADASQLGYYLGTSCGDIVDPVGADAVGVLAPNATSSESEQIILTSEDLGTRYLIVVADDGDAVVEGNEQNNVDCLGPVTIQRCYTLDLAASPLDGGTLMPASPNCGGGTGYLPGSVVTVNVDPASDYLFDHWTGDASGSDVPLSITMDGDKSITAVFLAAGRDLIVEQTYIEPMALYYVGGEIVWYARTKNSGALATTQTRTGLYMGTTCEDTARLVADVAVDSLGPGEWELNSVPYTFTVADLGAHYLVAKADWQNAEPNETSETNNAACYGPISVYECYTLSTAVDPLGGGAVLAEPSPNCGSGGYISGTQVTMTAYAAASYEFEQWSGDVVGAVNPVTLTVTSETNITANFAETLPDDFKVMLPLVTRGN